MKEVYLWEAGSTAGVTDDLVVACDRAATCLLLDGASEAVVETAWFDDGARSMDPGYTKSDGPHLTAWLQAGRVTWSDHRAPPPGAPEPAAA